MIEPKFKAWDKEFKDMFPVVWINWTINQVGLLRESDQFVFVRGFKEVELMQFAKSWDIEHREVYQGDILEGNDGFLYRVMNNGIKFYLVGTDTTDREVMDWTLDMFNLSSLRIVGNIKKSPELLGRKNGKV